MPSPPRTCPRLAPIGPGRAELRRGDGLLPAPVRVRVRTLLGDLDVEGRARGPVRLDPDAAVDPAHELAADVEAEPGAADAAAHAGIEAVELLEDPALVGGRNPEPRVGDREADVPPVRREQDRDRPALGRVLDRV